MESIHTLFEVNHEIILFIYGQAFFVLGLALAMQSYQHSRLDLARSLPWLTAFGFTHGFHEWGDLFIPIQATYLGAPTITLLTLVQLMLLAVSFVCLFEFGVTLLRPGGRGRILYAVPLALFVAWLITLLFFLLPLMPSRVDWNNEADALARYFIGFPGGLLAAYALRAHSLQRIAPLNAPQIVNTLRIAGIALFLYSFFAGLIPPPVTFFPGDWLNSAAFETWIGLPPLVFRALLGFGLALAMIRALEVFELETERAIESMEQQQILASERDRIARELHDGVIQKVYSAGLLIESAQKQTPPDSPMGSRLDKAVVVLNDAIADLRRNLGELRAAPSGRSLYAALHALEQDPRFRTLVDLSLDLDLPPGELLTTARTDDVMAIVNEALSNVLRHARARHVKISARCEDDRLVLTVQDDGAGLPHDPTAGYGLRNMRDRARMLGGEVEIAKAEGKGTRVRLNIPWRDEQ